MRINSMQHAVDLTRKQWTLIRDNPTWNKSTALEAMGYDSVKLFNRCFLCEYKEQQEDANCSTCPLVDCIALSSVYQMWASAQKAHDIASKCACAQSILDKLDKWEGAHLRYHESAVWGDIKVERNPLTHPDKGDLFKWTTEYTEYYFVLMRCVGGYALVDVHSGSTKAGFTDTAIGALGGMTNGLEYIGNAANLVFVDLNLGGDEPCH